MSTNNNTEKTILINRSSTQNVFYILGSLVSVISSLISLPSTSLLKIAHKSKYDLIKLPIGFIATILVWPALLLTTLVAIFDQLEILVYGEMVSVEEYKKIVAEQAKARVNQYVK